jgi:hypothetical protein
VAALELLKGEKRLMEVESIIDIMTSDRYTIISTISEVTRFREIGGWGSVILLLEVTRSK